MKSRKLICVDYKSTEKMIPEKLIQDVKSIRQHAPLVHNITNYVVMNNTANALLAIGASPVMAHAKEEVADMVNIASSLVLNMGTLSPEWVEAMLIAGERALERELPIVFDPVGVGATAYRTQVALEIIEKCKPSIIRGNASEIMALVNSETITKGVDSLISTNSALDSAKYLAKKNSCVVVISGEIDYITDGEEVRKVRQGTPLMARVTGMGCTATAIVGAFAAVNKNRLEAAYHAMLLMGTAGELAEEKSSGPGSMQVNFLDVLYTIYQ
jgi:hydroxyethylthiazole kinase